MRALVLALAFAACGGGSGGPRTDGVTIPADRHGPGVTLRLAALDGGELDLATLRGKLVVLHVFTTWSLAAQVELDALAAADAAEDVVVVGIALDEEGRALVAPWRNGAGVRYLVTLADASIRDGSSPLGPLTTVPTTFVLDRGGRVRARAERALAPGELDGLLADARR
jgi:hypothetical protein